MQTFYPGVTMEIEYGMPFLLLAGAIGWLLLKPPQNRWLVIGTIVLICLVLTFGIYINAIDPWLARK